MPASGAAQRQLIPERLSVFTRKFSSERSDDRLSETHRGGESSPTTPTSSSEHLGDVTCGTPTMLFDATADDPDLLCYGDSLRLWTCSEYALLAYNGDPKAAAVAGGYVGVYFKGRKRKARTRQQPLFCVPPLGPDADGDFVESLFHVVDPTGKARDGEPVRLEEELALVDSDSHIWNTSTAGMVGYLAPRLRGEVGETRVRFVRDLQHYAVPKGSAQAPCVRFGDALWLVTCSPSKDDPTHPGARRGRKAHVLTNFKKDSSSLLGGYLTIDARGSPLLFTVCRPAPKLDRVDLGAHVHHRVPWGTTVGVDASAKQSITLFLSGKTIGSLTLGTVVATKTSSGRLWLRLESQAPERANSVRKVERGLSASPSQLRAAQQSQCGAVLLDASALHLVPKPPVESASRPRDLVVLACAAVPLAVFAKADARGAAAALAAAASALAGSARGLGPAELALAAAVAVLLATLVAEAASHCAALGLGLGLALAALASFARGPTAPAEDDSVCGELTVLEWSPEGDNEDSVRAIAPVAPKEAKEGATEGESADVAALAKMVLHDAISPRWLEPAELLRFVRARKTTEQRCELFREAMAWRRSRAEEEPRPDGYVADKVLGSFGAAEQKWCDGAAAPAWWAFLSKYLPFELYGADRCGLPVTYLGLGRMDLAGASREIGVERLEQKIVMQNDMFIDAARIHNKETSQVHHGGVMIIDCDGMGRRHLAEIKIFRRVSAALKVLHPERQRKTFVVRAPRVFSLVWKMIKPMLDARTISKIQIIGVNDPLDALFAELGAANIPTDLGGSYKLRNPPSHDLIKEGAFEEFKRAK
ncbi:hypothetical protein M885DRAFT_467841 [Pelagophyceae sp. CCMP2097]|nr:hypothetical protein M885DRAFT_467841 [Pelagophyceae sp. CCMP2097]|mmetsp:Transcript_5495/g.19484  ORF Transcript_5495/g.19484 Transcript_5495/m.19484 type:complete len:821 (-) Transcript_5495:122-2584(-)